MVPLLKSKFSFDYISLSTFEQFYLKITSKVSMCPYVGWYVRYSVLTKQRHSSTLITHEYNTKTLYSYFGTQVVTKTMSLSKIWRDTLEVPRSVLRRTGPSSFSVRPVPGVVSSRLYYPKGVCRNKLPPLSKTIIS